MHLFSPLLRVAEAAAPKSEALALARPPRPLDACANSSANLAAAECTAWLSLYDGTGGATQWTHCQANRLDPCNCSYVASGHPRGVTCSADGQHILEL
jgi:hypothetical protein